MFNFVARNIKEIIKGDFHIFARKFYKIFKLLFIFIYYLPSLIFITFISLTVIYLLKPFVIIRFQEILSSRIGHFAGNLDLYMEEKKKLINIKFKKKKYLDIFFIDSGNVSNLYLYKIWKKKLNFLPRYLCFPIFKILSLQEGNIHLIGNNAQNDRDIYNLLENADSNIELSDNENKIGEEYLKRMGVQDFTKIICLNVRDSAFLPNLDYHNYRDGNINEYIHSAEYLSNLGFYIFRMGKKVNNTINNHNDKIIDYASSPDRSDFLDIYLAYKCKFCISTSSGFDALCTLFRKPIAFVTVPLGYIYTFNKKYLSITKHHVDSNNNQKLSIEEIFKRNCLFALSSQQYKDNSINLIHNNKYEILDLCLEMLDLIENNFERNLCKEEKLFWEKFTKFTFNKKQDNMPLHGKIRSSFSKSFLINNNYILSNE